MSIYKLNFIYTINYCLITGKFYFVSKNGRIEKIVDAHKGAVLTGQWIHDGSALLTGKLIGSYG